MKLQASHLYKSFGAQDVLSDASLTVKGNEKIALVGRNGCGKTTLLKMICHLEEPDQGSVVIASGTRIGYLSQITFEDEERTVYEELLTVFGRADHLAGPSGKPGACARARRVQRPAGKIRETAKPV